MGKLSFTSLREEFLNLGLILSKESNNKFEVKQDNGKAGRARRINVIETIQGLAAVADWLTNHKATLNPVANEDKKLTEKPAQEELKPVEYIYTVAPAKFDNLTYLVDVQVLPLVNGDGQRWREIQTTNFNVQFDAYIAAGFDAFNRESWEGEPDQLGLKFLQVKSSIASTDGALSFLEKQPLEYYKPTVTSLSPTSEVWAIIKVLTDNPDGLAVMEIKKYVPASWDILTASRRISQAGYGVDISTLDDGTMILKLVKAYGSENANRP